MQHRTGFWSQASGGNPYSDEAIAAMLADEMSAFQCARMPRISTCVRRTRYATNV